jgi:nucleoid-associated protein YgaU
MAYLITGVTLIVLALLVGVGFFMEIRTDIIPPAAFGDDDSVDSAEEETGLRDTVIHLDGNHPALPDNERSILDVLEAAETREGALTIDERRRVDAKGYLVYAIKEGESLSMIAERYLGNRALWRAILSHNGSTLADPSDARPGVEIRIPLWLREY